MTKKVQTDIETVARIRVVGCGGSGGNAINHMIATGARGIDFIAVNTDAQDLVKSRAKKKIHIGAELTRGLGTGMNPELGKKAAEVSEDDVKEALAGSDMVFVTCGMGGGTGTGSAPVVAQLARSLGALTVGVVTRPFHFEGEQRRRIAEQGIAALKRAVDALIVIPNDKILTIVGRDTGIKTAFAMCDDVLKQAVEGISEIITTPGIINVDFADVRAVMANAGSALIGIGSASGEKRAEEAARLAINSPLLDVTIHGAKGVLFSVSGGEDLGMLEVQDAAKIITESIDKDAKVIFGAVQDEKMKKGELRITVIATGFPEEGTSMEVNLQTPEEYEVHAPRTARPLGDPHATPASGPVSAFAAQAPRATGATHNPLYTTQKPRVAPVAPSSAPTYPPRDEYDYSTPNPTTTFNSEDLDALNEAPAPYVAPSSTSQVPIPKEDPDDEWSSFPSFLRRK